jgi:hypothetical protein
VNKTSPKSAAAQEIRSRLDRIGRIPYHYGEKAIYFIGKAGGRLPG